MRPWPWPGFSAPVWFRIWLAVVVVATSFVAVRLGAGVIESGAAGSEFRCPDYRPLAPVGGGVTHIVDDQAELAAALKSATPGDTINLNTGVYQEIHFRSAYGHRSGSSSAPVVIQAAAGAKPVIDGNNLDDPAQKAAVLIANSSHVMVRGLEIRNRFFGAMSWGSSAVTFEHNNVHSVGHSAVIANAFRESGALVPSNNVVIRCNRIHRTGLLEPEYGEGIYVGTGIHDVADTTNHVLIEGNEIFDVSNEAIDVKHHVTNVTIRHNQIHDANPHYGGAISLGLNKHSWGPANYTVEYNQIWNIKSGLYYAQAIAVAHGPTTIRHNKIWNVETSDSDNWPWTSEVQIHGDDNSAEWAYGFGNPGANLVEIMDNTIIGCIGSCIDSTTDPGQIRPRVVVSGNIVDARSTGDAATDNDRLVTAADLVGPLTGAADAGSGPGSGLEPKSLSQTRPATTERPVTTSTTSPPSSDADVKPDTEIVLAQPSSVSTTRPAATESSRPRSTTTAATAVRRPGSGPDQTVVFNDTPILDRPLGAVPPTGVPRAEIPIAGGGTKAIADDTDPLLAKASRSSKTQVGPVAVTGPGRPTVSLRQAPRRDPRRPVPGPRSDGPSSVNAGPATTMVPSTTSTTGDSSTPPTTIPSGQGPPAIMVQRSIG